MATTVAIVLDRQFADRLRLLDAPDIWVIRSPANTAVTDHLRVAGFTSRVTTFADYLEPEAEAFDELLRTVDLHHGEFSQSPPYDRLEVYGLAFDDAAQEALGGIGFAVEALTASGFTARRAATMAE